MTLNNWYWYIFEDGYKCCVMGFSDSELMWEISKHGKLVKIIVA